MAPVEDWMAVRREGGDGVALGEAGGEVGIEGKEGSGAGTEREGGGRRWRLRMRKQVEV